MINVVTTSIPFSKKELEEDIGKVKDFAHMVQVDISDGIFTTVKTWPYNEVDIDFFEDLKNGKATWPYEMSIELHLMIENPEYVLPDWIKTGITSVVVHIEATKNFQKVIDICRENSVSVGVAIKPSTDISLLEPFVVRIDFIQVMGSDTLGMHGVSLEDKSVMRIKELREMFPEVIIAIDIGVNKESAEKLVKAGANKLVSGGVILKAENPEEVFRYFESLKS